MKQLKKLVIYRDEWVRGEGFIYSALLTRARGLKPDEQKKCCLGFAAEACGVTRRQMYGVGTPAGLSAKARAKLPTWFHGKQWGNAIYGEADSTMSKDIKRLMKINDDGHFSDATREKKIIAIFAKHGVKVVFKDTRPTPRRRRAP